MLNKILVGLVFVGTCFSLFNGTSGAVAQVILTESQSAVELMLTICGNLCFWGGIMEVVSRSRLTMLFCGWISPITKRLFPTLDPKGAAMGYIGMNMMSNLLGLGNAATPYGIKAVGEMKKEEKCGDCASNNMVTFLVLNTASFQLIPTSIAMIRSRYGSVSPFEILPAVWLATAISLAFGLTAAYLLRGREQRGKHHQH